MEQWILNPKPALLTREEEYAIKILETFEEDPIMSFKYVSEMEESYLSPDIVWAHLHEMMVNMIFGEIYYPQEIKKKLETLSKYEWNTFANFTLQFDKPDTWLKFQSGLVGLVELAR